MMFSSPSPAPSVVSALVAGMSDDDSGMSDDPTGMSEDDSGMSDDAAGMSDDDSGMSEEPAGMSDDAAGMSDDAAGAAVVVAALFESLLQATSSSASDAPIAPATRACLFELLIASPLVVLVG